MLKRERQNYCSVIIEPHDDPDQLAPVASQWYSQLSVTANNPYEFYRGPITVVVDETKFKTYERQLDKKRCV